MSPINLDSSRRSILSLDRTVVLVFQQINDLTDHDQNGTQSHKLTSSLFNSKRKVTRLPLRAAAPDCKVALRFHTSHTPSRAEPAPHPRTRPWISRPESEGRSAHLLPPARPLHQTTKASETEDCAKSAPCCDSD